MADQPRYPGAPRWAKAFAIIIVILVALFAALHLAGRGLADHGAVGGRSAPEDGRR
jgi:hypothetical protein